MRKFLCFIAAILTSAPAFAGETTPLRSLDTLDASRQWQAVGRLNMGESGFCTGALIAPDLVLTAAHCLFDHETRQLVAPDQIEFLAGWRGGRATAHRMAAQVIVHPAYHFQGLDNIDGVASDIALVQLSQPIHHPGVKPFETVSPQFLAQSLQVVSYAKDRSDAPSIQSSCEILARDSAIYVTSCQVDSGASGAPVFVVEDGVARIMSVVSAKAEWNAREVSLMTGLNNRLNVLTDAMAQADALREPTSSLTKLQETTRIAQAPNPRFIRP